VGQNLKIDAFIKDIYPNLIDTDFKSFYLLPCSGTQSSYSQNHNYQSYKRNLKKISNSKIKSICINSKDTMKYCYSENLFENVIILTPKEDSIFNHRIIVEKSQAELSRLLFYKDIPKESLDSLDDYAVGNVKTVSDFFVFPQEMLIKYIFGVPLFDKKNKRAILITCEIHTHLGYQHRNYIYYFNYDKHLGWVLKEKVILT
jgi:hypothetical protein